MVRFFEIHENMKRPREAVPNLYPRHKSAMFCFLADDDDQQHFNLFGRRCIEYHRVDCTILRGNTAYCA